MKILGVFWFTNSRGSVGVVRAETECDGICYFISAVPGFDEEVDTQYIADWGARFPTHVGDALFGIRGEP